MPTPHRTLIAAGLAAIAAVAGSSTATAQSIGGISTTIRLDARDLPVTVTHNYERGSVQVTYAANGAYTQPVAGLGALVGIRVFGSALGWNIIDNETTPGTGHTVRVSTSTRVEGGTTTGYIIIEDDVVL